MTTKTATKGQLALLVTRCDDNHTFTAVFLGPDADARAVRFIHEYGLTHAIYLDEERFGDLDTEDFPLTMDRLYPTCEHGMAAWLCEGPGHYPADY